MTEPCHSNDHDLLIRVDENLKNLIRELQTLRDSTIDKMSYLESNKADRQELKDLNVALMGFLTEEKSIRKKIDTDLDDRVRSIEKFTYVAIGVLGIVQMVFLPLILKFIDHV